MDGEGRFNGTTGSVKDDKSNHMVHERGVHGSIDRRDGSLSFRITWVDMCVYLERPPHDFGGGRENRQRPNRTAKNPPSPQLSPKKRVIIKALAKV